MQDLDWDRLVGQDEVTVFIPSAVLAELDKHKSDGNGRRAQRARAALTFLEKLLEAPDGTVVLRSAPAKVIAQFAPEVSGDDSTSNDDSILFEVGALTRTKGSAVVSLVTDDTNLKVKAKRKGLRYFSVPNEWLLPAEPDERDKRVRRLEEEVALLKRQVPVIKIALKEDSAVKLIVPKYDPLTSAVVELLIEKITSKFPKKSDFSLTPYERLSAEVLDAGRLFPPTNTEIAKYRDVDYPEWVNAIRGLLERLHISLRIRDAKTLATLLVGNDGAVPGKHLEVALSVSEGLLVSHQGHHNKVVAGLFRYPRAPSPPQAHQASWAGSGNFLEPRSFAPIYMPEVPIQRDRDEFYRKTGDNVDTEWIWACENMRHGKNPHEFSFIVGMNAQAEVSGGQMTVEVSAENLPKPESKNFLINIISEPADTEKSAYEWLGLGNED